MKGRALKLLLAGFLLGLCAQAGAALTTATAMFDPADVQMGTERSYDQVRVDGCQSLSDVGRPELPVRLLRFVVPADARVEHVVVSFLDEEELPGTYRIMPAQPDVPTGTPRPWADPDPDVYSSDAPYPANRIEYLGDGYFAGYRIATVAVHPLQYSPQSGRLSLARELSVELKLARGADRSRPRIRITESSDRLYRHLVESLVVNPHVLQARTSPAEVVAAGGTEGFVPRYTPSLEGSPVEYIIVTSDEFEPLFQELADWKIRKGVPAVVRTISWIEDNYEGGADTQERIRSFIRDAYESWGTTYVLLGGDTDVVPARYAHSTYAGGGSIPSDLYYSALDGDWNGDGDALFGEAYCGEESPGDSIDLYPDVFVGRATVSTVVEVETFLAKLDAYVTAPHPQFTDRNLILAEVLFPYDWEEGYYSLDGAGDVIEPALTVVPPELHVSKLYANHMEYPDSYPLNSAASMDSLDVGYNLAVHVGHGNKDILRVSKDNYITMSDISTLSNGLSRSSFLWLLDCSSAAIDFDCIAERALNNPDGGAVGAFGSTRIEFPGTVKNYLWEWFDLFYAGGVNRAGEVCALAKAALATPEGCSMDNTQRWTQLSMLLLGDPEMPIWSRRATTIDASHDTSVTVGPASVAVTVTDGGPVEGAVVCLSKDGDVYELGVTDGAGVANFSFTADTVGSIDVTVTAVDRVPSQSVIEVLPTTGAHVYLNGYVVDDDGFGDSSGNDNGQAEAGETVEIDVKIENGGGAATQALTATLSSGDAEVTIEDSVAVLGSVEPGAVLDVAEAFVFVSSPDCPAEFDAHFTIEFASGGPPLWTDDFVVRIHRPELYQLFIEIDDSLGDGDGVPEPGETVGMDVHLANDGTGDAVGVSGVLSYPSGDVSMIGDLDYWGDLQAGEVAAGLSGFSFAVNSPPGDHLRLDLTDSFGTVWSSYLDLSRPSAPDSLWGRVKSTTIELSWIPAVAADLRGYSVYRSESPGGPFDKVNNGVLEGGSYYADSGLAENTLYYYQVTAVDSSGNESEPTETLPISTNPPAQTGWPLVTGGGMYSSPALVDLDADGTLEVVTASEQIYAWHYDGTEVLDGDGDPRTGGIFETDGSGGYRCSPAVGEVDGDPDPEIVAAAWADVGPTDGPVYEVWVWNAEDGSVVPGWPAITKSFCWASPALADLDRDGRAEIAIACADGNLYCWRYDGTEYIDGDDDPTTPGVFADLNHSWTYGSTAVADLDGDHVLELIQPSANDSIYAFHADGSRVAGWPVDVQARSLCSPAVGDVDNDGSPEVLVGSNAWAYWLLRADGTVMDGWPKGISVTGDFPPSPALADISGDGFLEAVLVGTDGTVMVVDRLGQTLTGWPRTLGGSSWSSPAVADVDGDPDMEIVVGCNDGKVYALDPDGEGLAGWPIQTDANVYCSPAIADLDGDGDNDVVVGGMDTRVYVWDTAGQNNDGDGVLWGAFLHDPWRSQYQGFVLQTGVDDDVAPWQRGLALEQNCPNPFNPVTTISFVVPEGGERHVSLRVYAVDGSLVRDLLDEPRAPGRVSVVWDGRDNGGSRVASGVYFYRVTSRGSAETRSMVMMK